MKINVYDDQGDQLLSIEEPYEKIKVTFKNPKP